MSNSHHYIDIKLMSQNYKFWLSQRVILMMSHWCQFDVSKIINSALPRESILRYQSDVYLLTYFIYCHDKPQNGCQNHIKIMISFGCHICDISVMSISLHKYLGSKFIRWGRGFTLWDSPVAPYKSWRPSYIGFSPLQPWRSRPTFLVFPEKSFVCLSIFYRKQTKFLWISHIPICL